MDTQKLNDDLVKLFRRYRAIPTNLHQNLADAIIQLVKNQITNEEVKQIPAEEKPELKIFKNAKMSNAWKK